MLNGCNITKLKPTACTFMYIFGLYKEKLDNILHSILLVCMISDLKIYMYRAHSLKY